MFGRGRRYRFTPPIVVPGSVRVPEKRAAAEHIMQGRPQSGGMMEQPAALRKGWTDHAKEIGGLLMDLDWTTRGGMYDRARQDWAGRQAEHAQQQLQAKQDRLLTQATQGLTPRMQALAKLNPNAFTSHQMGAGERKLERDIRAKNRSQDIDYRNKRDVIIDGRYVDETQYRRGRDVAGDAHREKVYNRGVLESDRAHKLASQPRTDRYQFYNMGDHLIRGDTATGEMEPSAGYMMSPDMLEPPPPQFGGDFWNWHGGEQPQRQPINGHGGQLYKIQQSSDSGEFMQPPPEEYSKNRQRTAGKDDQKRLQDIQALSSELTNSMGFAYDEMEELLNNGAPIGPNPNWRANASRLGLGFLPGVPSKEQAGQLAEFQGLAMIPTMARVAQTKGAISNKEMDMFMRSVPNAHQDPSEARAMIESGRKLIARTQDFARAAAQWEYTYGGLSVLDEEGRSFDNAWAEYIDANPFMSARTAEPTSGYSESANIPSGAIQMLQANPGMAEAFNEKYGNGRDVASQYLR